MKIGIQVGLAILSIFIAYLIWDSIDSKIILTETVDMRNEIVQEKLTRISEAQVPLYLWMVKFLIV